MLRDTRLSITRINDEMNTETQVHMSAEAEAEAAERILRSHLGSWTTRFSCGSFPEDITGTAEGEWITESLSLVQRLESSGFGTTFRSVRVLAYNPLRHTIQAASVEGAGVGIATGVGSVPLIGEPLHLVSRVDEHQSRELDLITETLHHLVDDDHQRLEIFQCSPGGRVQIGTVEYERR